MNITIGGLFLASALLTVGCADAFARHISWSGATFGLNARERDQDIIITIGLEWRA